MPVSLHEAIGSNPHVVALTASCNQMEEVVVRARRRKQLLSIGATIVDVINVIFFKKPRLSGHWVCPMSAVDQSAAIDVPRLRDGGWVALRDGGWVALRDGG